VGRAPPRPDAGKVKLDDLPPELDENLLGAMGTETANVHSWSLTPLTAVLADLEMRGMDRDSGRAEWFRAAVELMKRATIADWNECRDTDLEASHYESEVLQ
jgi:hypothetical protein